MTAELLPQGQQDVRSARCEVSKMRGQQDAEKQAYLAGSWRFIKKLITEKKR